MRGTEQPPSGALAFQPAKLQKRMSGTMNIYVGNLPYSVRDEELRAAFERFGVVTAAEVIFDKRTRRSRGYGFVEMADDDAAQKAIAALNGSDFQGRELRVDASQPKAEKTQSRPPGERPRRSEAARAETSQPASGGGLMGFFKRLFG